MERRRVAESSGGRAEGEILEFKDNWVKVAFEGEHAWSVRWGTEYYEKWYRYETLVEHIIWS